ncbi:hypothetical protein niasHT_010619 [Heterodera trifolii]|uniref:Ubiquitin-like domain-containing protein n=1 Tax=Heterodera trifolii TaxID=157864 RepID=A0ABD2LB55_9BILA
MNLFGFSQFCTVIMLTLMMPSFADSMEIKVIVDGERFPILVDKTDTVATLKAKIEKIEEIGKIPIQKQILFNKNNESVLEDEKTMEKYGIGEGITIWMKVVTDTYFFHINVNYGSKRITVWVNRTDTVKDSKKKIANFDKFGNIPIQKQVLFNEKAESVLEDKKTMDEYGIGLLGTIYMEVVTDICNFPIHVNYGSKRITVFAKGTDTGKDLKKNIATIDQLGNIPIQKQVLTKHIAMSFWIELADDEEIGKYAIGEGKNVFVSSDEFEFFVEYKEKMIPIKMKAMTTIKEVKEQMTQITGIPAEKQTLSHFKYGQIYDHSRLINYMKEDMPFLIMSDGSGITVWWTNHFWEFFVININGTDTVATMKEKIRALHEQRHKSELNGEIILSKCDFDCKYAKALADDKTMDEYGIIDGNDIHMKVLAWDEIWHESSPASSSDAAVADGSNFHIHVRYSATRFTYWVKGTDTVKSFKDRFGNGLIKLPSRAGIQLADNGKTIDEYGIKEGDTFESLKV